MIKKYDAVVILGGGVKANGHLPIWVRRRLDLAIKFSHKTKYFITTTAYTSHKPPFLDKFGFPICESIAMAKYLIKRGVGQKRILTENLSQDTIGNAYFVRLCHTGLMNYRKLLVITSDFHMPRSQAIFKWVFGLNTGLKPYHLTFKSASDSGIDPNIINPRIVKEKNSLDNLTKIKAKIKSLKSLHEWIFFEHKAYAPPFKRTEQSIPSLSSY